MTHSQTQIPIPDLIQNATNYLKQKNYSKGSIRHYTGVWRKLLAFSQSLNELHLSETLIKTFLAEVYNIHENQRQPGWPHHVSRTVNVLKEFELTGAISIHPKRRTYQYPPQFEEVFIAFIQHRRELNYSARTEQIVKLYLERFGQYLDLCGIGQFSQIKTEHLHGFVEYEVDCGRSKCTVCTTLSIIGGLCAFAYGKYHAQNLNLVMPRSGYRRNRPIPTVYSKTEVKRLLKTVDRGRDIGKRDYAILLLAARLGMRSGDICELNFDNIKWELNKIKYTQHKTGVPIALPLLPEIGVAIIDYFQNGRPVTDSRHIFVRCNSPFVAFSPKSLQLIMKRYLLLAHIHVDGRKTGLHALRHSLADTLQKQHTPLPVISEVLGHTNTRSAQVYLKVDVKALQQCALEVPDL